MKSKRRAPRKWDGRSWQARFAKDMRARLLAQIGKPPCATQATLIDIAVMTALDLEIMERKRPAEEGRSLHDHRAVLAYRNTLRRTMQALGLEAVAERVPTLQDYLSRKPDHAHAALPA